MRSAHGQRQQAQILFNLKESKFPLFSLSSVQLHPKSGQIPPHPHPLSILWIRTCAIICTAAFFWRFWILLTEYTSESWHTVQVSNSEENFVICAFAGASVKFSWNMTDDFKEWMIKSESQINAYKPYKSSRHIAESSWQKLPYWALRGKSPFNGQ